MRPERWDGPRKSRRARHVGDVVSSALDDHAHMREDVSRGGSRPLLLGDVMRSAAAFSLPTGTVTFVLTDLDRLSWKRDAPEAVAAAITQLDIVLDEAIGEHGGARPTQPGSGDTVVAVFSRASDAVRAALDAQRALSAQAGPDGFVLRARMAVHTGEAQLRDEGSYFGHSVARCGHLAGNRARRSGAAVRGHCRLGG